MKAPSLKVTVIAESRNRIDPTAINCQQLVQAGPPRGRSKEQGGPRAAFERGMEEMPPVTRSSLKLARELNVH